MVRPVKHGRTNKRIIGINMTYPTPSGTITGTGAFVQGYANTGNFQADMMTIVKQMNAQGDTAMATQFQTFALNWHAQHPVYSATQALQAFLDTELAAGVGTGIGATGTFVGNSLPTAVSNAASNTTGIKIAEALGGFNLSGWFLRIGEILLGLVLVGVGVARITGAANVISKAVKAKLPV